MKIIKKILALILIFSMLACALSCGKSEKKETGITFTDQAGRTVTLEKTAEKTVSCYYISTYAMIALGKADSLVGIEKKADTRAIYKMTGPELLSLPGVGTMKEIDVEKIASLKPDLVILPKKLKDQAEILENLGLKTVIVNPESDALLREMLTILGKACGAEKKAADLVSYYDNKLNGFNVTGEKPKVLFLGNSEYLTVAPEKMYQSSLITLAGGENAFKNSEGTYWAEVSYEALLQMNPDYIIVPSSASYSVEVIENDKTLAELAAVKNHRIYRVPGSFDEWDSPIPSGVLGVLWLRTVLNPDKYSLDSFRKDVKEFYETYYGFTPTEEQLNAIK